MPLLDLPVSPVGTASHVCTVFSALPSLFFVVVVCAVAARDLRIGELQATIHEQRQQAQQVQVELGESQASAKRAIAALQEQVP